MTASARSCLRLEADADHWAHTPELQKYGAYKLGQTHAVDYYAKIIAEAITGLARKAPLHAPAVFTTTPFRSLPSASNLLVRRVRAHLDQDSAASAMELVELRKHRGRGTIPDHYANLDSSARTAHLSAERETWIPDHRFRESTVVIVDDVRVTGSHERALRAFMRDLGATHVHFQYLFSIDPVPEWTAGELESELNRKGVKDDQAFVDFIAVGEFTITTRFAWRLMELPELEFHDAMNMLTAQQIALLVDGLHAEGDIPTSLRPRLETLSRALRGAEQ